MSPKLATLSGHDVAAIFGRFGFTECGQSGSHLKMRRLTEQGQRQTLVIPLHKDIKPGTLREIFRQALRYIPEDALRPFFFT
jgi:predicted RNA binding protein YcfA (HicA-like mRNA interferase family)